MLMTEPFVSIICRESECKYTRESDSPKKIVELIKAHHQESKGHKDMTYIYSMEITIQKEDKFDEIENA